jgi:hypothetical protein
VAAEKERKKENKATMMKSGERKENFKGEFFFSSFLAFGGQQTLDCKIFRRLIFSSQNDDEERKFRVLCFLVLF